MIDNHQNSYHNELSLEVMTMVKKYQKIVKYLKDHPNYNAFLHIFAGMAVGIMMTYPFAGTHPVRWAVALMGVAALGHLYPLFKK